MSADIAEAGKDLTVVCCLLVYDNGEYEIARLQEYSEADTMKTADNIHLIAQDFKPSEVFIDATGVGKGVADRLHALGYNVTQLKVGSNPTREKHRFTNLKAQIYWATRLMFEEGRISVPDNSTLKQQLNSLKWEKQGADKIRIIDPSDKSPDFADSVAYSVGGSLCAVREKITSLVMKF